MAKKSKKTATKANTTKATTSKAVETKTVSKSSNEPVAITPKVPERAPLFATSTEPVKANEANVYEEIFVQFNGRELSQTDILNRAREDYANSDATDAIVSLKAYLKPEENKVYYVVNDNFNGSFDC